MNHNLLETSIQFNLRMAEHLEASHLDFLIWASPLGCRDPEELNLWHPIYFNQHPLKKIMRYVCGLCFYSLVGSLRFLIYKGFFYRTVLRRSSCLLIMPDEITDHSSASKTDYILENHEAPVDRFVFSTQKRMNEVYSGLKWITRLQISFKLMQAIAKDLWYCYRHHIIRFTYLDVVMTYCRWVLGQYWYFQWDFYHCLSTHIQKNPQYKILLALHEMHLYSRLMWKIARDQKRKGVTVQHGFITPEKLWFFNNVSEIEKGCPTPHIFYVYDHSIQRTLEKHYPYTRFFLCCSPRFLKWKDFDTVRRSQKNRSFCILFASALMFYEVALLIQAIRKLRVPPKGEKFHDYKIVLRLHPSVKFWHRVWLKFYKVFFKYSFFEQSSLSLQEDLSRAGLVVGIGSTVLQEATILGIPVLNIKDENYMTYTMFSPQQCLEVAFENFSWDAVLSAAENVPDIDLKMEIRQGLGLKNPVFSTKFMFDSLSS